MVKKSNSGKAGKSNPKMTSVTKKSVQSRTFRSVTEKIDSLKQSDRQAESIAGYTLFTDFDIHLFREGRHIRLYEKFGSHEGEWEGIKGTYFAVWAPNAKAVSVIGNFNHWNIHENMLGARWDSSGIWEGFIPHVAHGEVYKYAIKTKSGNVIEKGDPYARFWEEAPRTASIIWNTGYEWNDTKWMDQRKQDAGQSKPMSVYEVHPGSWRRNADEDNRSLTYAEMADELVAYVKEMGYTHVEFMPLMEHPFYGSWGYQITGYFAATSRYGDPQGLMHMIDKFHQEGIGVILDWVPSHFPGDSYGLFEFDGTHFYEHADLLIGFHPDLYSYIFNYGRPVVVSSSFRSWRFPFPAIQPHRLWLGFAFARTRVWRCPPAAHFAIVRSLSGPLCSPAPRRNETAGFPYAPSRCARFDPRATPGARHTPLGVAATRP